MNPKTKAAEESGFEAEIESYETIMCSLQAGVCRLDRRGAIIYVNDTAAGMLGREKTELVGSQYFEVFFSGDADREDSRCAPFEFTLTEGEISHVNTETLVRFDGTEFLAELICVPVNDRSGVNGAVVSLIDVTDQRQVEDAVANARDIAIEAARSKADFLANMSHEIRTPLTGIIGTADLLSGTGLDDDQREILEILRNSTELLRGIVNEILEFSKIEAGKFVSQSESISLRSFIKNTAESFRSLAADKNIELASEFEDALPDFIECDSKSLQQVLNNLLSNALKFTEEGGVILKVSLSYANDRLRFVVHDTGIGIPESERERLFAPFEQADTSDSRRFGGTGLGLAISRRLVKIMGGEIGYVSEEDNGTEFWFEIPFASSSQAAAGIGKKDTVNGEMQRTRILIVEDNPVNLLVTERLLKQYGIEAASAINGEEAIALCQNQDFDIVLMDCQMPGMDGYEAAAKIRKNGGTASIIAFTASIKENDRKSLAAAGMNGILRKPFTQNELIDIVKTHGGHQLSDESLDLEGYFREYSISKYIEPETLKQLSTLDTAPRGFLSEILGVFVGHFSEKLAVLESGIVKLDRREIESAAHNLKGSSANLGFSKLSGLLETLEAEAGGADIGELKKLLYEITHEFGLIRDASAEI